MSSPVAGLQQASQRPERTFHLPVGLGQARDCLRLSARWRYMSTQGPPRWQTQQGCPGWLPPRHWPFVMRRGNERTRRRGCRISAGLDSWQGQPLPHWDGYVDGVAVRRERADPAVVLARRVVQEVQVNDEVLAGPSPLRFQDLQKFGFAEGYAARLDRAGCPGA